MATVVVVVAVVLFIAAGFLRFKGDTFQAAKLLAVGTFELRVNVVSKCDFGVQIQFALDGSFNACLRRGGVIEGVEAV